MAPGLATFGLFPYLLSGLKYRLLQRLNPSRPFDPPPYEVGLPVYRTHLFPPPHDPPTPPLQCRGSCVFSTTLFVVVILYSLNLHVPSAPLEESFCRAVYETRFCPPPRLFFLPPFLLFANTTYSFSYFPAPFFFFSTLAFERRYTPPWAHLLTYPLPSPCHFPSSLFYFFFNARYLLSTHPPFPPLLMESSAFRGRAGFDFPSTLLAFLVSSYPEIPLNDRFDA